MQDSWPKFIPNIHYTSDSFRNTLETCIPSPIAPDTSASHAYWLIFIHGGAWRDPHISAPNSFHPTRDRLLASPVVAPYIAGYASLDYRLSPYPHHPDSPSTPSDSARSARHPDHIRDILAAILHLQQTYAFGHRYLLIGHSAGATLALQVAMSREWSSPPIPIAPPTAILGLAGIYDLPAFAASSPPAAAIIANAFGPDPAIWRAASPALHPDFASSCPSARLVVLAHSPADPLVPADQPQRMLRALRAQAWRPDPDADRRVVCLDLHGGHDDVWQTGDAVAPIEWALRALVERA